MCTSCHALNYCSATLRSEFRTVTMVLLHAFEGGDTHEGAIKQHCWDRAPAGSSSCCCIKQQPCSMDVLVHTCSCCTNFFHVDLGGGGMCFKCRPWAIMLSCKDLFVGSRAASCRSLIALSHTPTAFVLMVLQLNQRDSLPTTRQLKLFCISMWKDDPIY